VRRVLLAGILLSAVFPLHAQVLDVAAGDASVTLQGFEEELAGAAVAVGDLDGDTLPDLAVGAPGAAGPLGDRGGAGAVYVFFDAESLGGVDDIVNVADFTLWGAVGDPDGVPPYEGDLLGATLLIADLDGDTVQDLAVAAPRATGPLGRGGAGVVAILLGPLGPGSLDLASQTPDHLIEGAGAGDGLGFSMSAGNFDGVQGDELLMGAPLADGDGNAKPESGETYLLSWNIPPPVIVDLAAWPLDAHLRGEESLDGLGTAVLMADVIGDDGLADLVLSATEADGPGNTRSGAGAVYVLDATLLPPFPIDLGPGVAEITIHGARTLDRAGRALAAPDWNADGVADLAVGAPGGDGPGPAFDRPQSGQTHLIYFTATGMPAEIDLFDFVIQTRIFGAEAGDQMGTALNSGQVVQRPGDTLAAGLAYLQGPDGTRRNAGGAALFGSRPGQPLFVDLRNEDPDVWVYGAEPDGRIGLALVQADLCGGALQDLVVAGPLATVEPGMMRAGLTYLFCDRLPNRPPTARAFVPPYVGCATGGVATVPMDGSGSTDPDSTTDTNDDIVDFRWYDGVVDPGNLVATGEITSADLTVGAHDVILVVEDREGLTDQVTVPVLVEETAGAVTIFKLARPAPATDLVLTWVDTPCADFYRVFRGFVDNLPTYDHSTPFGVPGVPECSAFSGVALMDEGLPSGFPSLLYYLIGGVNAPAGTNVVGGLGAADLDGDGIADLLRPRPGQVPTVIDSCP